MYCKCPLNMSPLLMFLELIQHQNVLLKYIAVLCLLLYADRYMANMKELMGSFHVTADPFHVTFSCNISCCIDSFGCIKNLTYLVGTCYVTVRLIN